MARAVKKSSDAPAPKAPRVCETCGQRIEGRNRVGEPVPKTAKTKKVAASREEDATMGKCLKGKSEVSKDEAEYVCKKCGARTDDKDHVCKPEKVKKDEKDKKNKKDKKGKKKEKKKKKKKDSRKDKKKK
jgi:hypothetical protein